MASGAGSRFGGNKLLAELEGRPLADRTMAALSAIGWPFATLILSPCFSQPLAVRFKSAGGEDAGFGDDPFFARQRSNEFAIR